jgi:hypothetical protein
VIEDLSMRGDSHRGEITPRNASFLVTDEVVEYLATGPRSEGRWESPNPSVEGEFVSETESARNDLCFDSRQVEARTPQIRLVGCPR